MAILGKKTTKQTNLASNCLCVCAYLHSKPLRPSLWRLIVIETLNIFGSPKISKIEGKLRSTYLIFTEVRKNNCWGLNETYYSTYTTCVIWSPSVYKQFGRISRKNVCGSWNTKFNFSLGHDAEDKEVKGIFWGVQFSPPWTEWNLTVFPIVSGLSNFGREAVEKKDSYWKTQPT